MHIFACQFDILWENRSRNLNKVRELLSKQTIPTGSLIVVPEMFSSGFSMNADRVKENEPSETEAFMANLAQQYQSCVIGGSVFSTRAVKASIASPYSDPMEKNRRLSEKPLLQL